MENTSNNPPQDSGSQPTASQPEEMKIEATHRIVKVKTLNNQVFTLQVSPTIPISELKKEIEKHAQVPPERQRLIYMGKNLHDEQALNTLINDDEQTIHLLAKTQQPTGPEAIPQQQPQGQGQPQSQGQPPQQNDPNAQNRNLGQGMFIRASNVQQPLDIGNMINSLLGPGLANLGGLGGVPTANVNAGSQDPNAQPNTNPTQGLGQGLAGSPGIVGLNFTISASSDPNDPSRLVSGQPQMRVISGGPGGVFNLNNLGQPQPGASQPGEQQAGTGQQQQGQQVPVNPFAFLQQSGLFGGPRPQPQGQGQNVSGGVDAGTAPRNVIELPHRNVFNIGNIINSLMGPGTSFPGPPMPQLTVPRNPVVLLGGFLNAYQFQLTRLIPLISRLGDLMQRESLMVNSNERHQVQLLAQAVGRAMEELAAATTPVLPLLRNVSLGNNPGEVRLIPPNQNQQQSQGQGGQASGVRMPSNLQATSPLQNISQILSGGGVGQQQQQQPRPQGSDLQNQNYSPTAAHTQDYHPTQARSGSGSFSSNILGVAQPAERREDRMEITDETEQAVGGGHRSQSSTENRPAPNAGGLGGLQGNVFGSLMGQMSTMGPGLMTQSIASFVGENREMMSEDEEQLMVIIGPLTIGDLFGLLTAGNTSCFDRIHGNMRQGVQRLLDKHNGNMESLAKDCAKTFSRFFEVTEENQNRVLEGFEPQTVAEEVSAKHLQTVFATVLKDYAPPQKFSDALVNDFKAYIKELFSEVSEGLNNGVSDLEQILKAKLLRELSNMGGGSLGGMEGLLVGMVWPNLWQRILKIYADDEQVENRPVPVAEGGQEAEDALLAEISRVLVPDSEQQEPPSIEFSEAYKKGDTNYEEKK